MDKNTVAIIYVVLMVAVVVAVDLLFFRHHPWERLVANIGVVLLFAAFYFNYYHGR